MRTKSNKVLSFTLSAVLFALIFSAEAQQPAKVPLIGVLGYGSVSTDKSGVDAFREGLRELGYVEGKHVRIEYRYANGKVDDYPEIASEMVRLKPDVIVVGSTPFALAVKEATRSIPIVAVANDLVGAGLVASLARPGGNVTGLTLVTPDLSGKRLELLKEVIPNASRVAVLVWPGRRGGPKDQITQTEIAARELGVKVQFLHVREHNELKTTYAAIIKERADGLILLQTVPILFHRKELLDLAAKNRLPSVCEPLMANDGCLISYGPNPPYQLRRAATFVDKILKGTKPSDLPVEQPSKLDLILNLKTAKQIGLTIPPNVLARADKVIK